MNLLLVGWSPSATIEAHRAEESFTQLLGELPFFEGTAGQAWRAPSGRLLAICTGHRRAQTAGVTYAHFEDSRIVMYSGRPFVWTGEFEADGRRALDPRFYLQAPETWSEALDGRCVVARYDDATSTLDLCSDPLGACHLYATSDRGTQWFSNSAELLRRIIGSRATNPFVIASLIGCGWSLGGQPIWQDIRRLPSGHLHQFQPETETHRELASSSELGSFFDRGFVAEAAAKTLVEVVRALADWPGRPSFVTLTGGRDSRLVFAAALQADIEFEPHIIVGASDRETPDVRTARVLCDTQGHAFAPAYSREVATVEDAAWALRLCAPGTLTLDLAWNALNRPRGSGLPDNEPDEPLALVHSGHGGEIARTFYGLGDGSPALVEKSLYRRITYVWPRPPLSNAGQQLIEQYLSRWVHEQVAAGVAPENLPDLFYLRERMSNWVGGSHGFDEYMTDITSPLWTPRLLPHEFGLPATERSRELFHFHVLNTLSPELTRIPFGDSNPSWPTFGQTRPARGQRFRVLAAKARREMRRRYELRVSRPVGNRGVVGLAHAAALARLHAPDASDGVWEVLDRKKTLALLAKSPSTLDARRRSILWRVATAFLVRQD